MDGIGSNPQGGIGFGGTIGQNFTVPPQEENFLEDDAVMSEFGDIDEEGNPLDFMPSSGAIADSIKEDKGLKGQDPEEQEMMSRVSKYIFSELQVTDPVKALQVYSDLLETAKSSSTVPEKGLLAVDRMIRNNKKIITIEEQYRRMSKGNEPLGR